MPTEPLTAMLGAHPGRLSDAPAGPSAEKAAKDFESVLLLRLLEEMKRTIPESGLLETGITKQVQDIFWYYLAQDMASKGGLGLWKELHARFTTAAGPEPAPTPAEPAP